MEPSAPEQEQVTSIAELELTVSHVMPGGENIKEFHVRACTDNVAGTLLLLDEAFKRYDLHMRTLDRRP